MIKYLKIFIITIFLLLVSVQSGKKFVIDEIDFPVVSEATSETGSPIYYRGEGSPMHMGIYHPTLYINSLALFIKIFGYSEVSVRAFGALCAIITSFIIIGIYNVLVKKENRRIYFEVFFLALFLLHPYTIASVTVPDIDTTILPVVILLFIYATFYFFKNDVVDSVNNKNFKLSFSVLSFLFALSLWGKLTTPLILPFFLLIWLVISKNKIRNSLAYALGVALSGMVIFLFTYWIYCFYLNLPFGYTFSFLIQSFTKGTAGQLGFFEKIIINLGYGRYFLYWLTIPLVYLFFVGVVFIYQKGLTVAGRAILLMSFIGFFVTIFYVSLMPPFAGFFKYPFASFSLLVFPIAYVLSEVIHARFSKSMIIFLGSAIFIISLVQSHFFGDMQFRDSKDFNYIVLLVMIVAGTVFLLKKNEENRIIEYVAIMLFITTLGLQIGVARVQAVSSYPTKYHYGQMGLDDTVAYLRVNTKEDEPIWSMKDVGYYVHNRYYENYSYFFSKVLQDRLVDMLKDGDVRYYVVTTGIGQDRVDAYNDVKTILDAYAKVDATFGNFIIYKSNVKR